MAAFELTNEQKAVVNDRGGTLLVAAAAGSGKTKVLIDRVLKRVEEGSDVDRFLLITFTKAAAAELRGKMIAQLSDRLSKEPNNRHLQKQMNRVYLAQISTVHSFCASVLREYAHELDLPADFRTAEDHEKELLQQRAMKTMLDQVYQGDTIDPEIEAARDVLGAGRDDRDLMTLIDKLYESVECWPDPAARIEQLRRTLRVDDWSDPKETLWGSYLFNELKNTLTDCEKTLVYATSLAVTDERVAKYADTFAQDLQLLAEIKASENWAQVQQHTSKKFSTLAHGKKCDLQEHLKALRDRVKSETLERLEPFQLAIEDLKEDIRKTSCAIAGLLTLVELYAAEYRKEKLRRRVLDYGDLEHEMLRLLCGRDGQPTAAAKKIAERFDEVMVDEYQDTNGVQDAIFGAIAYRGNLFMVGDVKQSIYRFRMADPTGFLNRYKAYADYTEATDGQPRKILLSDNFRSAPEVISAVNDLFRMLMTEQVGGLRYGDAEALKPKYSAQNNRAVELHCIDMGRGMPKSISKYRIEAEFLAKRIRRMLDNGEMITLKEGTRPIRIDDIAVLMRSMKHSAEYLAAFQRYGIRCVCGNENFLATTEIGVLMSLLKVIDNPYQDVPLLSVLFSPLFCFTADELAQLRANERYGNLYDALSRCDRGSAFVEILSELRDLAGRVSLHTLLDEIDERLCLRAIYPHGGSNFDKILALADSYENSDRYGLAGFLNYLQAQKEKGISNDDVSAQGAVRMMTMHKSKGLEFPVVFLAGLSKRFNNQDIIKDVLVDDKLGVGSNLLDTDKYTKYSTVVRDAIADRLKKENKSEEMRILYVAMTRAKCRLIMSYCLENLAGKLTNIGKEMMLRPADFYISSAGGIGDWVLMCAMTRTEAGDLFARSTYTQERRVSDYPWKIAYHEAEDYLPDENEQNENTLNIDVSRVLHLQTVQYPYASACVHPGKITATQLKGKHSEEALADDQPQNVYFTKPNFQTQTKLDSAQRGTAIHLAMEHLCYEKCTNEAAIAAEMERLVDRCYMTQEQADAVPIQKLLTFFRSDLGQRILSAKELVREFKFSVLDDGGIYDDALVGEEVMLQGVADCCLIEDDGLILIDFKSDRISADELQARAEHYKGQLAAYSRALSSIFERPVKERVLYFVALDAEIRV